MLTHLGNLIICTNGKVIEMKETVVKINASVIDSNAHDQIKYMAKSPAFHGLISIMPDVHFGIGAVIGFTGKFKNCVIPNVVGVDIGCGVTSHSLEDIDINFEALDKHIRHNIPLGFNAHRNNKYLKEIPLKQRNQAIKISDKIENEFYSTTYRKYTMPLLQIGTLGGGNHFIEIDTDENGHKFLTIHSGSRNFGYKVAKYYQDKAVEFHKQLPGSGVSKNLEYLPMKYGGEDYLKALYLAQEYASLNRRVMISRILKFFDIEYSAKDVIESIHNYISPRDGIIRKGAISAHEGEKVIIPLNMRDGIILGTGKGKSSYNFSAPHGAGRVFGRRDMKRQLQEGKLTMLQFEDSMKGVFSTSINKKTIDESPFAYKSFKDIEVYLEETVEITKRLKPVYNLKAT